MKLLKLVPDHTNVDFMRWRNVALIISLIATVASIGFTIYRGLNLGIDFIGGQVVRAEFARPVPIEQLRTRIDGLGVGEASIQALDKTPPADAFDARVRVLVAAGALSSPLAKELLRLHTTVMKGGRK